MIIQSGRRINNNTFHVSDGDVPAAGPLGRSGKNKGTCSFFSRSACHVLVAKLSLSCIERHGLRETQERNSRMSDLRLPAGDRAPIADTLAQADHAPIAQADTSESRDRAAGVGVPLGPARRRGRSADSARP